VNINTSKPQTQTFQYFTFTSQSVYVSFDNILLGNCQQKTAIIY